MSGTGGERYDVVVIGAGSGRMVLGSRLAGLRTAIIDSGPYGGTCLNRGCIPSKMLIHAAEIALAARGAARFGVDAGTPSVRWADLRDRVFARLDANSADAFAHTEPSDAYAGRARFVGPGRLAFDLTGGRVMEVSADQVVVAVGARPVVPDVVATSGVPFETSDTVMRMDTLPQSLLILGGGVLGVEMAHLFDGLGVRVTIVDGSPELVGVAGEDLSRRFTSVVRERFALHLSTEVESLAVGGPPGDGPAGGAGEVRARLADGTVLTAERLLVASGRVPQLDGLGLDLAGVATSEGRIVVDEYCRTSAPGVWALGDCAAPVQLKHVANDQARTIAHNIASPDDLRPWNSAAIPSGVFTDPQLAWVGVTPQEAGERAVSFTQKLSDTAYGWALEDTWSVCTVVADRATGVVLGAQLMAPQATSLIQPLVDAVARGRTARDVARGQLWIHPAAMELVENALVGVDRARRSG